MGKKKDKKIKLFHVNVNNKHRQSIADLTTRLFGSLKACEWTAQQDVKEFMTLILLELGLSEDQLDNGMVPVETLDFLDIIVERRLKRSLVRKFGSEAAELMFSEDDATLREWVANASNDANDAIEEYLEALFELNSDDMPDDGELADDLKDIKVGGTD